MVESGEGSGSITVTGGHFTFPIATKASPILIEAGLWRVHIDHNRFTLSAKSQSQSPILIANQLAPTIYRNTIDSTTPGVLPEISIQSTGSSAYGARILDNTLSSHSLKGSVIKVGLDQSTANDGEMDGTTIRGNTIYGRN